MKKLMTLMLAAVALLAGAAEKELRMGVYIYDYSFRKTAEGYGEDLKSFAEKHFQFLQKHHVNAIHLTVAQPDGKDFREVWLPLMRKYGIKAYLQLDFAYFLGGKPFWTEKEENRKAKLAIEFIREFRNEPMIMAFSIREEISPAQVDAMARFYSKLRAEVPDFKIVTLHNNIAAAKKHPAPVPAVLGTDRYCFWWEFSADGYLASPAFALNWLRTQADQYYQEAAKRGADYLWVVTVNTCPSGQTVAAWKEFGGKKPKAFAKVEKFSREQRFGWKQTDINGEPFTWCWRYYRPPVNCTRAMIWTGILEGARCVLFWSYAPVVKGRRDKTVEQILGDLMEKNKAKPKAKAKASIGFSWSTMAGRPGEPNQPMEEFAAAAEELRPYSRLICMMTKLQDSPVTTDKKKKFFNRAFSIPGYDGRAVILHNANVGTWGANSRTFFKDSDDIRIDENANLIGYTPFTGKQDVEFSVKGSGPVFDFATGEEIKLSDGKGKTGILPGGGTVLFIGSRQEFERLKAQCAQ